ncbi:M43 family zinc metalloprotease [Sphingobacterium bovistauri]|uniref:Peptidase M43 pregnancy-associated plasma-A domain-containing protein n=1 Tax=Sphingobacterium bovistauri TaxID=2781959 RepID=A0ABS7Z4C0_9SPHI|nr:M43 family zinc metalloprotease [Sphingobacterium bovistauri]MCA5005023.1 hypothetical protein [Sphingobacterium bovistauri]
MKKILYILLAIVLFQSCQKESFEYVIYKPTVEDIDSIYFSTGSKTLIADGKASLNFVIETFRKVRIANAIGQQKDTLMFVDYKTLPHSDIKIYANGSLIKDMIYKTTNSTANNIEFYAEIGNQKSVKKLVEIRQPQGIPQKIVVDVVFHVFELSITDVSYDPLRYQSITSTQLQDAISYANAIFNNSVGNDANSGNANIEFRLAKTNASGAALAIPGYNRIQYDATWKTSATAASFTIANFTSRINSTVAYQWNKDKFLNIYVIPSSPNNSIGNNRANYQIVKLSETPLLGITNVVNSQANVPTTDFYTNYGLGIHRSVFFPDPSRQIEIAGYLGLYYGLYATHTTGTAVLDYVNDTNKYLSGTNQSFNNTLSLYKLSVYGEKFLANNAMDDIRYASLRNTFTIGQVERMRLVMERSPVRTAWVKSN